MPSETSTSNYRILQSDNIEKADANLRIARYFTVEKTLRLCADKGLWFSSFSEQRDKNEGRFYSSFVPVESQIDVAGRKSIQEHSRLNLWPCISCWTNFTDGEDEELWRDYTNDSGICVVTTVGRLQSALPHDSSGSAVPCGHVQYTAERNLERQAPGRYVERPVFYDPNNIEQRSYFSAEFVKLEQYQFEREVRFMVFGQCEGADAPKGVMVNFSKPNQRDAPHPFAEIIYRGNVEGNLIGQLSTTYGCPVKMSALT